MSEFHFVRDYENLVSALLKQYPQDEAMARAVGGLYEKFGLLEAHVVRQYGLKDGMHLVDLGCGSGRLATVLHGTMQISYTGIDIVQSMLDYAATKAPRYKFILHRELSIPLPDASADMVTAFSLFTHLHHAETYVYLAEVARILKPGGRIVLSFLEFAHPPHWNVFMQTVAGTKARSGAHLNMFIERNVLRIWAARLKLTVETFVDGKTPILEKQPFGQSIAVLQKP